MALPLRYNLRNVAVRWRTSLLAIGGIALVVAVLVVLVAMSEGFRATLRATGRTDNAIVVMKGSNTELTSSIRFDDADFVMADTRIARDAEGRTLVSPEMVVVANLPRSDGGASVNLFLRGVTPMAYEVRGGVRIIEGRAVTPGLEEIVVGRRLVGRYRDLELGGVLRLKRRDWRIVGVFASDGSGFESEIWGDARVMQQAFNREGSWQSITARMAEPSLLAGFAADLERNPRMQVDVHQERRFYEEQAGGTATFLLVLAGFISVVMGIGAVFGATNTMYGIVAARTQEIATLRALGFSRRAVLVSFVTESVVLAAIGGLLGVVLALPFDNLGWATGNSFREVAFAFRISTSGVTTGLVFALAMGVVGGLLPALRAARIPVAAALREA